MRPVQFSRRECSGPAPPRRIDKFDRRTKKSDAVSSATAARSRTYTHNLYNLDPKLGPLADLGGPTPTHALRFDSPALDAGHSGGLTTDQRGLPRPIDDPNLANPEGGDGSDIGAYEADPNLRIMAIEKIGADIRLRFNTVFGRSYFLENEDGLAGPWSVMATNIIGDGSSVQAIDAGAASLPHRFYRAVLPFP